MVAGDTSAAQDGGGAEKLHPYLIAFVRWCVSCIWSSATLLLHRLVTARLPALHGVTASEHQKPPKPRPASNDHLHPEPLVECVVLHEPEAPEVDVIFLHGLYGSLKNTWRQGDWRWKYKIAPNRIPLRRSASIPTPCDCSQCNLQTNEQTELYDENKPPEANNCDETNCNFKNRDNKNKIDLNESKGDDDHRIYCTKEISRKNFICGDNVNNIREQKNDNFDCDSKCNLEINDEGKENIYKIPENVFKYYDDDDLNESFESIGKEFYEFNKHLPNDDVFMAEGFYKNTIINQVEIIDNYEIQANFVRDLFELEDDLNESVDCEDLSQDEDELYEDDRKHNAENEAIDCVCKKNNKEYSVGCGCACDACYSSCWPRDWLRVDCPRARVLSVNYTSDPHLWRPLWVKGTKRLRLHERAEQMMEQLLKLGVGERPIIWVGHSKGGLFIKQIYCEAYEAYLKTKNGTSSEKLDIKVDIKEESNTCECNETVVDEEIFVKVPRKINKEISEDVDKNFDHYIKIRSDNTNNMFSNKSYSDSITNNMLPININSNDLYSRDSENNLENNLLIHFNEKSSQNMPLNGNDICNKLKPKLEKTIRPPQKNVNFKVDLEEYKNNDQVQENENIEKDISEISKQKLETKARLWMNSAGFMFYSVPHRGSPLADIKTPITTRSIELLEMGKDCSLVLTLQDRWLRATAPSQPLVRSLVETCRTLMSVLWLRIVSVDSADAGIGALCGVSVDHREICKPTSRQCILYVELLNLINAAINKCNCK